MSSSYKTIEETRRENLRRIVERYASVPVAAKALERSDQQLRNLLNPNSNEPIGNRLARDIERLTGEEPGWLDTPPTNEEALKAAVRKVLELSTSVATPDIDLLAEQAVEVYEAELGNTPIDGPSLLRKYTALAERFKRLFKK